MSGDYLDCPTCGAGVYKTARRCPTCNHTMDSAEGDGEAAVTVGLTATSASLRPTGSAHILVAVLIGILAVLISGIAAIMPDVTREYGILPPEPNHLKFLMAALGNWMFALALALWAVGQIVKAISFVGRAD